MKKIIYILVCMILFAATSCDSFLDEKPKSAKALGQFYKTEADALANVSALYRNGFTRHISGALSAYVGPEASIDAMLTGYFSNAYEGQEVSCMYARQLTRQQYTAIISSKVVDPIWNDCYEAINIANGAITYIPEMDMSAATSSQLIAEAKFFRAFNYYYLVKTFGDVPMPTEPYESLNNLYLQRTPAADVYTLIESDLDEAVQTLPASTFAANSHRITKYAAAMLLTKVYMRENKYAEAANTARIVIESPHALTANSDLALQSAFNKLRSTDDLDEVIYAQEFDAATSDGGWWPSYAFDASATSLFKTYSIYTRVFGPTDRFLNVYKKDDLRIQPNQFFHWAYTNPVTGAKWESEQAGCWYYYDEDALLNSGKATKDWNFFRYAEALLDGAEAIAQSGGVTSEAADYLAQIKARADMNGKTVAQYTAELQTMSKDDFVKECWTERLREFPLEFKIWDDCTRTGMFPVISETEPGKVEYVSLVGATNGSGAVFKDSDLLWPISLTELQRNPSLVQNAGYPNK